MLGGYNYLVGFLVKTIKIVARKPTISRTGDEMKKFKITYVRYPMSDKHEDTFVNADELVFGDECAIFQKEEKVVGLFPLSGVRGIVEVEEGKDIRPESNKNPA